MGPSQTFLEGSVRPESRRRFKEIGETRDQCHDPVPFADEPQQGSGRRNRPRAHSRRRTAHRRLWLQPEQLLGLSLPAGQQRVPPPARSRAEPRPNHRRLKASADGLIRPSNRLGHTQRKWGGRAGNLSPRTGTAGEALSEESCLIPLGDHLLGQRCHLVVDCLEVGIRLRLVELHIALPRRVQPDRRRSRIG